MSTAAIAEAPDAGGAAEPVMLVLARLRDLSFSADQAAVRDEAQGLLMEAGRMPPAGQQVRIRLDAHRHIHAFRKTGSLDPAAMADAPMRGMVQVNELFHHSGCLDTAAKVLWTYHERWPSHDALGSLAVMINGIGRPDGRFRDDPAEDIQVVRRHGASATILVFTCVNHGFGMSLKLLYHFWLSALNANIVFVRDFDQLFYLNGVRSLGSLPATVRRLGDIVGELAAPNLATIGFSMGNFGTLHYGAMLGAQRVVAFAGPTSIEIGLKFPNKQSYPKVIALHAEGKLDYPDLREVLAAAPGTQVQCFYSRENKADRLQAENLRGLPNVEVCPVDGTSHFTLKQLADEGRLGGILHGAAGRA